MIRRPPRSTLSSSSAASDVYKRQVVILMRACDRGKSEARGTRSAEGAPCEDRVVVHARSNALTWYPKFSALDPLGNVCSVCSVRQRLHDFIRPLTVLCLGDGPRRRRRACTFLYPAHIFHYAAVGTLVELSWKHAHGPGRAVLGASWVRDILRNLKHRAFLTNAPRSRAPGGLRVARGPVS